MSFPARVGSYPSPDPRQGNPLRGQASNTRAGGVPSRAVVAVVHTTNDGQRLVEPNRGVDARVAAAAAAAVAAPTTTTVTVTTTTTTRVGVDPRFRPARY